MYVNQGESTCRESSPPPNAPGGEALFDPVECPGLSRTFDSVSPTTSACSRKSPRARTSTFLGEVGASQMELHFKKMSRAVGLAIGLGAIGSLAFTGVSHAQAPVPGTACQASDGKISGRGATFQTLATR